MLFVGMIAQAIVYLCFSLLLGSLILSFIPNGYKPTVKLSSRILRLASIGIAVFSFFPVLQILFLLVPNLGLSSTLQSVLFTFEVGKAWIFTFIVALFLYIFLFLFNIEEKQLYRGFALALTILLILALGWSSHPSSYNFLWGFIGDTLHFTAVSIWVGILLVISFFAKDHNNWLNFLKWFTPVALTCFIVTMLTGLLLMNIIVEDYTNAWLIPYGQSLLIKHLLIVPLIGFAFINSVLIKKKLHFDSSFHPLPWVKVESIFMLLIFSITAALGQQSPPRETTVSPDNVSTMFSMFYQGSVQQNMTVELAFNMTGALLIVLAVLFMALLLVSFLKKMPAMMSFLMGIGFVFSMYVALILSVN